MSLLALMADKFELEPPPPAPAPDAPDASADDDGGGGDASPAAAAHSPGCRTVDDDDADARDFSLLHAVAYKNILASAKDAFDENSIDGPLGGGPGAVGDAPATKAPPGGGGDADDGAEETKLLVTFLLMVIVGTANKVFQKLQAIPMYNYPNSLNLLQNFVYVPLCFAYILPVSRFGLLNNAIPAEVTAMEKKPFAVMGFLDCLTCMLLTFAAVYLPGTLLILLPQAAIPISMILSKKIKGETYAKYQYVGAVVVVLGILVVLEPLISQRHVPDFVCEAYDQEEFCALCEEEATEDGCLSHLTKGGASHGDAPGGGGYVASSWEGVEHVMLRVLSETNTSSATIPDDHNGELCRWTPSDAAQSSSSGSTTTTLLWSVVTILACVPMTLSSIYKEQALSGSRSGIDPIFLNGWVALFQLLFSFPLSVPAGMTTDPPVTPADLPKNIWDGIRCYLGMGTIDTGCHPDDQCSEAPLYVNVFLLFNVCFNILIVYILKFGSANVLFMASTVMVPVGNLAFALPFVPGSAPLKDSDVAGLLVILLGLVTYRFGDNFRCGLGRLGVRLRTVPPLPWRRGKNPWRRWSRRAPGMLNDFEWDAPVFDDEGGSDLGALPPPSSLLDEPLLAPATPVR